MTEPSAIERRTRRLHLAVTLGVTAAAALILLTPVVLWAGELPPQLATHFDASGVPNETTSRVLALGLFALTGVGLPAVLVAAFAATRWWRGENARLMTGFLAGLPAGLVTLFVSLISANRGVSGPQEVRFSPWLVLIGLGVALVVGLVAAAVVPRGLPRAPSAQVAVVPVAPGERASWFGRAHSARSVTLVLLAGTVLFVGAALASGVWWLWLLVIPMVFVGLGMTSFAVRVDRQGVSWRGSFGFPRGRIPMEQITKASLSEVSPASFGGFGLRMTPDALGLITRGGTALEVEHGQRRFVATVDDAATAAGLLNGYLQATTGQ